MSYLLSAELAHATSPEIKSGPLASLPARLALAQLTYPIGAFGDDGEARVVYEWLSIEHELNGHYEAISPLMKANADDADFIDRCRQSLASREELADLEKREAFMDWVPSHTFIH